MDLLETIREDYGSDIPFIIFTGKGREEVAIKALNLGADRYIQKGGDPKSQYNVLARAIENEVEYYRVEREKNIAIEQWKKTFDGLPDIALLLSPDFEILRVNQMGVEELGLDKWDIIGDHCYKVIHGRDEPMDSCPCLVANDSNSSELSEVFVENEGYYVESASPISGGSGNVKGYVLTIKDITDYKNMKNNLKAYRKAVEGADNLLAAFDDEYNYLFANEEYRNYHRIKEDEIKGKSLREVFSSKKFENEIKPKIDQCLEGKSVQYRIKGDHPIRGKRDLRVEYHPLKDNGKIQGVVSVIKDISNTNTV